MLMVSRKAKLSEVLGKKKQKKHITLLYIIPIKNPNREGFGIHSGNITESMY